MIRALVSALAFLFLLGCSSAPATFKYYVLSSPDCCSSDLSTRTKWVLQPVRLADYLKQSSLVMQTAPHQLHYASLDIWSEPITKSIPRVLVQQFNQQSEQHGMIASTSPGASALDRSITVQIDDFLPNERGEVILKGQYWVQQQGEAIVTKSFHYTRSMQQDGFAHAVALMNSLLEELAGDVSRIVNES
ncbi:PqiC family protein [Aestuariibacter salexigens]|uniref:PqiC family protein n=1 Tax=Aestuariibacter salexigens TaxID=226010 RepID=UPI0004791600|nr:PqiC family protein [Aestuariibacter salexigens]